VIGVDTNVLARLIVEDDKNQLEVARRFFSARSPASPALISLVVIAELAWVLRNPYAFSVERVIDVVDAFLSSDDFAVERRGVVEGAVHHARASRADIADCLIAALAIDLGATTTVTFDKKAAAHVPGMELLK
jgi:predicted nucleic-acid-binding protein